MDFMRTLLAYMAATLLVAVESTATPQVTTVPTPGAEETPPPVVMVTEAPTEEPTVSVTPVPVPTISPNPKYHNLEQGDKGSDVRALQERLIELGYLPEGAADGAYGGQTRNAVRRFQYYNSLTVDGIAGRATQTNLFENPDVMPYPGEQTPEPTAEPTPEATAEPTATARPMRTKTPEATETPAPTEAPTEAATEAPTEAPTEAATEAPTEAATEAPTEAATEAPTEAPTEAATEAPTEAATEAATEAPTEAATEAPTEMPAEAATETPAPTEAPTEAPTPEPTPEEIVEVVVLEEPYEDLAGWIVLNDSGAAMQYSALQDGVPILCSPRMQKRGDSIRISLADVVQCVEGWTLTDDGDTVVLEAQGYTLGLFNEEAGFVVTADGIEIQAEPSEYDFSQPGNFIDANLLARAMGGTSEWDEEEWTLMLRIPEKSAAEATD